MSSAMSSGGGRVRLRRFKPFPAHDPPSLLKSDGPVAGVKEPPTSPPGALVLEHVLALQEPSSLSDVPVLEPPALALQELSSQDVAALESTVVFNEPPSLQ